MASCGRTQSLGSRWVVHSARTADNRRLSTPVQRSAQGSYRTVVLVRSLSDRAPLGRRDDFVDKSY